MTNTKDSLGDRIKIYYEDCYRTFLPRKLPVVLRLDGTSFHQYTKGLKRPVDEILVNCMNDTAKFLCQKIQGAQFAYVQSDEISILINNYKEIDTQPWFGNNIQKMVSVSAGMASSYFTLQSSRIFNGIPKLATFDSRVFVLPFKEVNNYFLWRQNDCTRNSISMLARSLYSHKELNNKNSSEMQDMIFNKGINWNDCPTSQKRGRCIIKVKTIKESKNPKTNEVISAERSEWIVDNEIPIFSKDKEYIEQYI